MERDVDFNKKSCEYYMAVYTVDDIRVNIITLVLGVADIFILLSAFANPVQLLYV